MSRKTENTYYICYAWCEYEERMVDFFGSPSRQECEEECQCLSLGTRHKIVRVDYHSGTPTGVELGRLNAESKGNKPKPSNGAEVLAWQQFKMHEGDKHLFYVLCKFNNQFVVWMFNASDGGCYYGKYFGFSHFDNSNNVSALKVALEAFEDLAKPHREYASLTKQEKFERNNEGVSVQDIPENYSHPRHLSHSLGEYEKEVKS